MRSRQFGPFAEQETALLKLLMPHLQRALQLHRRLAVLEAQGSASLEVLDHLAAGIVLVKANGQVLFLNRAAQQILDRKDGLSIGLSGLSAANSGETRELRKLIEDAALLVSGSTLGTSRGVMTVSRPSCRRPLSLLVIPAPVDHARRQLLTHGHIPSAIILISDPEADLVPDSELLQRSFGLTPAEARFASILMGGKSVEETAVELQVTMHTARTHLKRILSKTGTRRQGELIHLLLKGFSHLRTPAKP